MMKIRPRSRSKIVFVVVAAIIVVSVAAIIAWIVSTQSQNITDESMSRQSPDTTESAKRESIIRVSAMGDMLAHDTINANAKTASGYDYSSYFSLIRPSYKDADVIFCNQEGLSAGEAFGISGYPSFNAPAAFSAGLQSGAGCNMINLANNHMGDKGPAATNATIDTWSTLKPLFLSGANRSASDQESVSFATVNDITIGFVSFADFNNNQSIPEYSVNNYHDESLVRRLVAQARQKANTVIVSMHWGLEDSHVVSADQQAQVTLLASLGVDVIIGTGPHVLQKVETIVRPDGGSLLVWYSLGNMLSSQLYVDQLVSGIAGFDIVKSENSVMIKNPTFIPTYMHYEWSAVDKANGNLLARKNARLYLLKDAAEPLSRSLLGTTVEEQMQSVTTILGPQVLIK